MNGERIILVLPGESDLPEIVMYGDSDSLNKDLHYEITADDSGKIGQICGEFGRDLKTASRVLLRTLLRLNLDPERALAAAKKFYLTAKRFSARRPTGLPVHASGNSSSSS